MNAEVLVAGYNRIAADEKQFADSLRVFSSQLGRVVVHFFASIATRVIKAKAFKKFLKKNFL